MKPFVYSRYTLLQPPCVAYRPGRHSRVRTQTRFQVKNMVRYGRLRRFKRSLPATARAPAGARQLHGRARRVAVRAEHAAVARFWAQHFPTMRALKEELAGVGRHHLGRGAPAMGTGQRRLQDHGGLGAVHRLVLTSATAERRRYLPSRCLSAKSRATRARQTAAKD